MNRSIVALLVSFGLASCNVGSVPEAASSIAKNQCDNSSACAAGDCVDGQCLSREGALKTVLFEVTPAADTFGGAQFLKQLTLGADDTQVGLTLDPLTPTNGAVIVSNRKCVPIFDLATSKDGSIPAVLTLTPTTTVLGLYSPRTVVQSTLADMMNFSFSVLVPPGQYDIYVQPKHQPTEDCPVPPALLRDQPITGGAYNIHLPAPSSFELHVSWLPADGALNEWVADMLEPRSGKVISNQVKLALTGNKKNDYVATLSYLPVSTSTDTVAQELVRLSPPVNVTAPSLLLSRGALGLFSGNQGMVTELTSLPSSVHVRGQVTRMATPIPAAASVTLVATKLNGIDPGVFASFVRTANVDETGDFQVDLLPGTYRVSAVPTGGLQVDPQVPASSKLAAVSVDWLVAETPAIQAGKVIELGQALAINGSAFSSSTALASAQVSAIASPASIQTDVLHLALGEAFAVPRASTGFVDSEGKFTLNADAGTFDISVQPLPNTGFGWLVIPNVPVGTTPATVSGVNLGRQQGLPPVRYHGRVSQPGTPEAIGIGGALIRAYVYLHAGAYTDDSKKADSVLQVAETRSDSSGNFDAFIPAALNTADPTLAP